MTTEKEDKLLPPENWENTSTLVAWSMAELSICPLHEGKELLAAQERLDHGPWAGGRTGRSC